jgi:alkanesulfonate monooxygenase SsuD/methylene tetrahydromethanopterin reductase-like flavin-dependent oxidoreductase (luciferase family)
MQALVGRYADEFNTVGGTPDEVAARFGRARAGVEAAGRDPHGLVTSWMTWFFVAPTQEAYVEKLRRAHALDPSAGPFDAYRADIEHDCVVGTPERAIARLRQYADVGVQRIFLNHELYDDLDMIDLVANDVLPAIP